MWIKRTCQDYENLDMWARIKNNFFILKINFKLMVCQSMMTMKLWKTHKKVEENNFSQIY